MAAGVGPPVGPVTQTGIGGQPSQSDLQAAAAARIASTPLTPTATGSIAFPGGTNSGVPGFTSPLNGAGAPAIHPSAPITNFGPPGSSPINSILPPPPTASNNPNPLAGGVPASFGAGVGGDFLPPPGLGALAASQRNAAGNAPLPITLPGTPSTGGAPRLPGTPGGGVANPLALALQVAAQRKLGQVP